jgi:hypothetical protein
VDILRKLKEWRMLPEFGFVQDAYKLSEYVTNPLNIMYTHENETFA